MIQEFWSLTNYLKPVKVVFGQLFTPELEWDFLVPPQLSDFHMFKNISYLEFGHDDSPRTTWDFAAEAAAQVWLGTHSAIVETKSRPEFDSVQW